MFSDDREQFESVGVSVANGTDVGREADTFDEYIFGGLLKTLKEFYD